ncbi:MAG: AbaSI family restriction endonuclease [Erythrobacter sp.]
MSKNKNKYVLKSLRKIAHKEWELFVISRIIHKLDDPEIEFVTQQLVRLPNNRRALTDLYFPQLNIHLEVDEGHHFRSNLDKGGAFEYVPEDELRENDIVQITGHEVHRIPVFEPSEELKVDSNHREISTDDNKKIVERDYQDVVYDVDKFIDLVKAEKEKRMSEENFEVWDFEARYDPQRVIQKGKFSIADNVLFRTQIDAMRCFGFTGKGWQRGAWEIPDGSGDMLWFPRLYPHGMWHNELIESGTVISERAINDEGRASVRKQRIDYEKNPKRRFIVFARGKDALGNNLFRYVGVFKPEVDETQDNEIKFKLVQDEIAVRPPATGS